MSNTLTIRKSFSYFKITKLIKGFSIELGSEFDGIYVSDSIHINKYQFEELVLWLRAFFRYKNVRTLTLKDTGDLDGLKLLFYTEAGDVTIAIKKHEEKVKLNNGLLFNWRDMFQLLEWAKGVKERTKK